MSEKVPVWVVFAVIAIMVMLYFAVKPQEQGPIVSHTYTTNCDGQGYVSPFGECAGS